MKNFVEHDPRRSWSGPYSKEHDCDEYDDQRPYFIACISVVLTMIAFQLIVIIFCHKQIKSKEREKEIETKTTNSELRRNFIREFLVYHIWLPIKSFFLADMISVKFLSRIHNVVMNILSITWLVPLSIIINLAQLVTLFRYRHTLNKTYLDIFVARVFISDQIFMSTFTLELLVEFCSLIYIDTALAFTLAKNLPGGENLDSDIIEARHLRRPPIAFQALIMSVIFEFFIFVIDILDAPDTVCRKWFNQGYDYINQVKMKMVWHPGREQNFQKFKRKYSHLGAKYLCFIISPIWLPLTAC